MKLTTYINLVADYEIGGRCFAWARQIESCYNLVNILDMTSASVPCKGGGFITVKPSHLSLCRSRRQAEMVAEEWNSGYKTSGKYYDYEPIDCASLETESEVTK